MLSIARSDAQKAYDALSTNPSKKAEFDAQVTKAFNDLEAFASREGIQFTTEQLMQFAKDKLRNNYSEADMQNIFAKTVGTKEEDYKNFFNQISGTTGVGADKNSILDWAKQNGVTVSDSWVGQQLKAITSNVHDIQLTKDYITRMAKLAFPAHADFIDAKTSVYDIAQTYAQKISSLLEVPFESVDLSNTHLQNALQPDENGKPKNLTQVEQELRNTSDWAKTNNAKETANGVVSGILGKFGLI